MDFSRGATVVNVVSIVPIMDKHQAEETGTFND
jgi:hypothetical protein